MRVIVYGSTRYPNSQFIREMVESLPQGSVVLSPDQPGAGLLAVRMADERGFATHLEEVRWTTYDRRSAMVCLNKLMQAGADQVWVFWDGESEGSRHAIELARRNGFALRVFDPDGRDMPDLEIGRTESLFDDPPSEG